MDTFGNVLALPGSDSHDPFQQQTADFLRCLWLPKSNNISLRQVFKRLKQTAASCVASDEATVQVGKALGAELLLAKKIFARKVILCKMITGDDCCQHEDTR
jgi:hypothetical protein